MERSLASRRRRLHLDLGAALLEWNHLRLAEEGLSSPMSLEQALGVVRTTLNGVHHPITGNTLHSERDVTPAFLAVQGLACESRQ
jgi:hypothetical protein